MIFDAHMHVGEFPLFDVRLDRDGLVELMAEHAYDGCVVFHPDNALVADILETVPAAHGLVWANPRMPGYMDDVERWMDHPRFVGVKMHPLLDGYHPDDPITHPIFEAAIQRDHPLLIHCGHPIFTLPWSIEEAVVRFPKAKVILGHMGHGNIIYINGAIDVAARNENVWLETSGMPMHTKIAEAVRRVGTERVLYGSDAPFHHPVVEMSKVRLSGLSDELVERVMGDNAARLFLGGTASREE
ncbi:MAG: amidohydrolase family protein [Thermoleophilia bacterium]